MKVPSGRTFNAPDIELLRLMHRYGFIRWGEFRLKSGPSRIYVSGREDLTDHPDLEWLIGRKIAETLWLQLPIPLRPTCLIGIPTAGTAFAQAAAMVALREIRGTRPIFHRIMREIRKEHGAHRGWVNGEPNPLHLYGAIDNVATDGESKIEVRPKFAEDGYPVDEMFWVIFVDRGQGAIPRLESLGFRNIFAVYNLLDIAYAFTEMKLWPKKRARAVEEEILTHQFPSGA